MSAKEYDEYLERNIVFKETVKDLRDFRNRSLGIISELLQEVENSTYENADIPLDKSELEELFSIGSRISNLINTDIKVN